MGVEIIQFSPSAGSGVKETLVELVKMAREKDCLVVLSFNGVKILIDKRDEVENLSNFYYRALRANDLYRQLD